jgi:hypothetical protein
MAEDKTLNANDESEPSKPESDGQQARQSGRGTTPAQPDRRVAPGRSPLFRS